MWRHGSSCESKQCGSSGVVRAVSLEPGDKMYGTRAAIMKTVTHWMWLGGMNMKAVTPVVVAKDSEFGDSTSSGSGMWQ